MAYMIEYSTKNSYGVYGSWYPLGDTPDAVFVPRKFRTEAEAQAHVDTCLSNLYSFLRRRYRVVPYKDEAWRHREGERLRKGVYKELPEDFPTLDEHYAHFSKDDKSKIAYTPDKAKGEQDIQVVIKPGRYLKKYFPDLSNDEIEAHVNKLAAYDAPEVLFAKTADEIEEVYLNGPNSCMSHPTSSYSTGGIHPVRVYGDSDLQVAYVKRKGEITARCLCWPERKQFGPVYGDYSRLEAGLTKLGYEKDDDFSGARIRKIPTPNGKCYVMPYLDVGSYVNTDGDYFVIGWGGEYYARDTCGVTGPTFYCACCDEQVAGEEPAGYVCDEAWCESCIDEYAVYCVHNDEYIHVDRAVYCERTGEYVHENDAIYTEDCDYVTPMDFEENGFTCAISGLAYMTGKITLTCGDTVHESCLENGDVIKLPDDTYIYADEKVEEAVAA